MCPCRWPVHRCDAAAAAAADGVAARQPATVACVAVVDCVVGDGVVVVFVVVGV